MLKATSETIESKVLHPNDRNPLIRPQTAQWNQNLIPRGAEFTRGYRRAILFVSLLLYCGVFLDCICVFALIAMPLILARLEHQRASSLKRELSRRVDAPSAALQFPAEVTLYADGAFTGEDQGWLCFVQKFLVFQGRRTYFSLLNTDVKNQPPLFRSFGRARSSKKFTSGLGDRLSWKNGSVWQSIRISPLEKNRSPNEDPIDLGIMVWIVRNSANHSSSTFPPFEATTAATLSNYFSFGMGIFLLLASLFTGEIVSNAADGIFAAFFLFPVWVYSAYLIFDAILYAIKTKTRLTL